jgi:hypothetical protein
VKPLLRVAALRVVCEAAPTGRSCEAAPTGRAAVKPLLRVVVVKPLLRVYFSKLLRFTIYRDGSKP